MFRKVALVFMVIVGLAVSACEALPPTAPEVTQSPQVTGAVWGQERAVKTEIAGNWLLTGEGAPGAFWQTPSGQWQFRAWPTYSEFTGDIAGQAEILQQGTFNDDVSHQTASGPVEAELTWQGRTGSVTGHWTTNGGENGEYDGTFMLHGTGELDGVKFQLRWWGVVVTPPFVLNYTGWAFDPRGG